MTRLDKIEKKQDKIEKKHDVLKEWSKTKSFTASERDLIVPQAVQNMQIVVETLTAKTKENIAQYKLELAKLSGVLNDLCK